MRVGIVGAGIAGLAASRELKRKSHDVVVFEKSKGVGGRCSTRRIDGFIFDTGATTLNPRGHELETAMLHDLDASDLVKIDKPIFVHESLRVTAGDTFKNKTSRYTYRSGSTRLAKLLADGIDIRLEAVVDHLERNGGGSYRLAKEEFDAVILTPPIPQTRDLLASIGEFRPLQSVTYRPCLSVLLGFAAPTPDVKYHAIVDPDQRHPLTWLSLESAKSDGRAPEGHSAFVAQLSPSYSASHFEAKDEDVIANAVQFVERLYGQAFETPLVAQVKRWKYSQPEMMATFDHVNRPGSRLLVASDGLIGPRVEYAYEAGVKAAALLEENA